MMRVNLGPREEIDSLTDEFRYNEKCCKKVWQLKGRGYTKWRRIRGDGNCFYRAVCFALLEELASLPPTATSRQQRCSDLYKRLKLVRFQDEAEMGWHRRLLSCVGRLREGLTWVAADESEQDAAPLSLLYKSLREVASPMDMALVRALRQLAALYILRHAKDESGNCGVSYEVMCASLGYNSTREFCQELVLPLGVEAEGLIPSAVAKALGIGLRIFSFEREDSSDLACSEYPEDPRSMDGLHMLSLQSRPGNFDVLYADDVPMAMTRKAAASRPSRLQGWEDSLVSEQEDRPVTSEREVVTVEGLEKGGGLCCGPILSLRHCHAGF